MSVSSSNFVHGQAPVSLHPQNAIRDNTMEISSRPLRTPSSRHSSVAQPRPPAPSEEPAPAEASSDAFIFPDLGVHAGAAASRASLQHAVHTGPRTAASSMLSLREHLDASDVDLEASTSTLSTQPSGARTPRAVAGPPQPSALSLLLKRHDSQGDLRHNENLHAPASESESNARTPTMEQPRSLHSKSASEQSETVRGNGTRTGPRESVTCTPSSGGASHALREAHSETSDESVPLLADLEASHRTYHTAANGHAEPFGRKRSALAKIGTGLARGAGPVAKDAVKSIPAVILGTLLNILDGISCEWISVSLCQGHMCVG